MAEVIASFLRAIELHAPELLPGFFPSSVARVISSVSLA